MIGVFLLRGQIISNLPNARSDYRVKRCKSSIILRFIKASKPMRLEIGGNYLVGINILVSAEIYERILDLLLEELDRCQDANIGLLTEISGKNDVIIKSLRDIGAIALLSRNHHIESIFIFLKVPKNCNYLSVVRAGQ